MKYTKEYKSVNAIEASGDYYARWGQIKKPINAVQLTVTDELGNVVFFRVCGKGGMLIRTLADCRRVCNTSYAMFLSQK